MVKKLKRILIMAGGTGGHVFPGLAVANYLRTYGIEVHWLGTQKGLEARLVPAESFPIHFISITGIRKKNWKEVIVAPWRLVRAILQAISIIRQFNPDIVIGMGGFVSGPGGIASILLRKKLIIHEQNAKAGLTNQYLSKVADKVLEAFPHTFPSRPKVETIGNPVRTEMITLDNPTIRFQRSHTRPRLLVLGGSLGAQALNFIVPKAIVRLPDNIRPEIWHQSGEKHYADTLKAYADAGVEAKTMPFITKMDEAYAWADMVLCRAGALTIAELCAVGLGAMLVPYPYAVDDHQTKNAYFMEKQGAALLLPQTILTDEVLAMHLQTLCLSPEKRIAMAEAAYRLRKIDAVQKVLTICEEIYH